MIRRLLALRGCIEAPLGPEWRGMPAMIRATRAAVPLLLNDACAVHVMTCARAVSALPGDWAEAGVFRGGSARLLCGVKGAQALHLFDVFDSLQRDAPAGTPGEAAVAGHFGATHARLNDVRELLGGFAGVEFYPGEVGATLPRVADRAFSFVHIDLDLPDAIATALDFFHARMVPGGIVIADDMMDAEVRAVVRGFYAGRAETVIELPWGQAMIVTRGASPRP